MTEHRFNPGDAGAGWWMRCRETLAPADRPGSAACGDEFAQRRDHRWTETEMDDAAIGLELGSVPDEIADSVAQVNHGERNPRDCCQRSSNDLAQRRERG